MISLYYYIENKCARVHVFLTKWEVFEYSSTQPSPNVSTSPVLNGYINDGNDVNPAANGPVEFEHSPHLSTSVAVCIVCQG